jgi:hypothetical protein
MCAASMLQMLLVKRLGSGEMRESEQNQKTTTNCPCYERHTTSRAYAIRLPPGRPPDALDPKLFLDPTPG